MSAKKKAYEGLQENVRTLDTPVIDVFENKYSDKEYIIKINTDEFTCVCPKTGLPDFAAITLEYSPGRVCVELKSFKEYLTFYRNVGIFHEHVTNRILDDFVRAVKPRWIKIYSQFKTRGGIITSVTAEYRRK